MSSIKLEQVPVLHVRGTNYKVGFAIGRTYLSFIQDFLGRWPFFKDNLLPAYATEKGRQIYEISLNLCKTKYPLYVQEMQGIADGAGIPFHQIFLLHIETYISHVNSEGEILDREGVEPAGLKGCSDILCNQDDIILAHTEDALPQMANNFYIVAAHIVDDDGNTLEEFTTLTYPGYLPGYTMGYNRHGIIHSVNTICPAKTFINRTPVYFMTRALLGARDKNQVMEILKDAGTGIGDGFSLNIIFAKDNNTPMLVHNIEVGPNQTYGTESAVDVFDVQRGSTYYHCNKYRRLQIQEVAGDSWNSTNRRMATIENLESIPSCLDDIKNVFSDRSCIFRSAAKIEPINNFKGYQDTAATIAVGVFDMKKMTWSIYIDPPNTCEPVAILPIIF